LQNIHLATTFRPLKIPESFIAEIATTLLVAGCVHLTAMADDETPTINAWTPQNSRFGAFDCLHHRSGYYQDSFPEPLLLEETSWEPEGELELNFLHTANDQRSDSAGAEFEKSFGVATLDLEVPYQRFSGSDETEQGVGNIELSVRCPIYQSLSADGFFDTTAGIDVGVGIPVNSPVSQNTELEPLVFDDLKFGNHFTVQVLLGYDKLFGGGDDGGEEEIEYGLDFGYAIPRAELPIPGVQELSPMVEVDDQFGLNEDEAGQNSVLGSAGFRLDFRPIAELEPSIGFGYVFPISSMGRKEVHWGIIASFTNDF
jgi:hypothetical protein